ncbi:MAG: hypothetical protein RIF37_03160 [Rhodospirillaceae bacterium]
MADGAQTDHVVALVSRIFLVMAIAFGTGLVTCLSALPVAVGKPELIDLYIMISRFALSGLIGAFLWYVPLVLRLRLKPTSPWRKGITWVLSSLSVLGALTVLLVLVRLVGNGSELLSAVALRFGTTG